MCRTFLVIPAYNEGASVARLCASLQHLHAATPLSIIFVNDGSTDDTAGQLQQHREGLNIEVIEHRSNQGVPQTFYDGLAAAAARAGDEDCICIIEADNTSDLTLIPRMRSLIGEGADLVIASRYIPGGGYVHFPLQRVLGSRFINSILKSMVRMEGVTDYTIFYRAYRAQHIKNALARFGRSLFTTDSFAANLELLLKLRPGLRRVDEVPLVYDYESKKSDSKIRIVRSLREYFVLITRLMREGAANSHPVSPELAGALRKSR
jgi:dolichol-phosphate mannosyltransferase